MLSVQGKANGHRNFLSTKQNEQGHQNTRHNQDESTRNFDASQPSNVDVLTTQNEDSGDDKVSENNKNICDSKEHLMDKCDKSQDDSIENAEDFSENRNAGDAVAPVYEDLFKFIPVDEYEAADDHQNDRPSQPVLDDNITESRGTDGSNGKGISPHMGLVDTSSKKYMSHVIWDLQKRIRKTM